MILYFFLQHDSEPQSLDTISTFPIEQLEQKSEEPQEESIQVENIMVDVKGAVHSPGVYLLTTEDRIIDAIRLAGGYRDDAETQIVNHAQKLVDEMVIYIPKKGEELAGGQDPLGQTINIFSNSSNDDKVNINLADESKLTTLPGIGPSKAQAIISYREENGMFGSIEDLKNVSGIGDKTFEKLKEYIVVR